MENSMDTGVDTGINTGTSAPETTHIDIGLDQFKHENGKIFGKFDDPVAFGNAYRELEKMNTKNNQELSNFRKANTAPDKYELTLDDDLADTFSFDENHPDYQTYMPMFKELGLSNDKVNKIVNSYVRKQVEASEVDFEAELRKVGGERGDVIQSINAFVAKNKDTEEFVRSKIRTADDAINMANIIKLARGNMQIPTQTVQTSFEPQLSKQDYKDQAFKYQQEHKATIGYNPEQQAEYMRLLSMGL